MVDKRGFYQCPDTNVLIYDDGWSSDFDKNPCVFLYIWIIFFKSQTNSVGALTLSSRHDCHITSLTFF